MPTSSLIRCGTAGWSHPHWNGVVYPKPRPKGFHELDFLCRYFDALEVNTTFYRALRPELPHLWVKKVEANPNFRFTVKLNRAFTHERNLGAPEIAEFKVGLWPFKRAGRLGCVLMQFPWSFRFTAENRDYLLCLRRAFGEFPLVAEMRHESWLMEEALGVLIDHKIGFCNIDQPEYLRAMPPASVLTSAVSYVRLLGRRMHDGLRHFDSAEAEAGAGEYLYTPLELDGWRSRIERLARNAEAVYVVTCNDSAGRSVVNALQMQHMLGTSRSHAPADLMRYYSRSLPGFRTGRPIQRELFPENAADSGAGTLKVA